MDCIADEIIPGSRDRSGDHPPGQVGVVDKTGIRIRYNDACRTGCNVPSRRGINSPVGSSIPLSTVGKVWIIRRKHREKALVRFGVLYFRQGHQQTGNLLYLVERE